MKKKLLFILIIPTLSFAGNNNLENRQAEDSSSLDYNKVIKQNQNFRAGHPVGVNDINVKAKTGNTNPEPQPPKYQNKPVYYSFEKFMTRGGAGLYVYCEKKRVDMGPKRKMEKIYKGRICKMKKVRVN